MLIKLLSWFFEPTRKTRRKPSSGGDELVGWVLLVLAVMFFLG